MEKHIELLKKQLETTREQFWNVDPNAGQLIQALIYSHQPKHILEIGTSNGYSAIIMAEIASQYGGHVTTIEYFEKRISLAQENIRQAGLTDSITILQGNAVEVLTSFVDENKKFDFFFLDANKKQYAEYFINCMQLVNPQAIITADNTISHRNQLNEFFEVIYKEKRAHILELSIGMGLVVITIE
ncbi:MAG TPA: class I SAM-dependent methyltransferase [Candidatus Andersenbacteria bacterium]|nr:class I SAM-dependent methyltransferase [Candidatus Andersenbacteria bacterium]